MYKLRNENDPARLLRLLFISSLLFFSLFTSAPAFATDLPLNLTPDPSISEISNGGACGNVPGYGAAVGATMSVSPGTWDEGVSLTYQWYLNNFAIPGATGTTYRPNTHDAQSRLAVVVTGSKPGYTTVSKRSTYNPLIGYGIYTVGTPAVSGIQTVGNTLTVNPGTWETGASLSYQWWRGPGLPGTAIPGATLSTYTLTALDVGRTITARVTGRLYGIQYSPDPPPCARSYVSVNSISEGTLSLSPSPSITGTWVVGGTLTSTPGTWDSGVSLSFQWNRNGVPITGESSATYSLVDADLGSEISVVVSGSKPGYGTISRVTYGPVVGMGTFTSTPTPQIIGNAIVGQTLTANLSDWDPAAILHFQWKRSNGSNWENIYLANSATYQITSSDLNKQLLLFVETTNSGYHPIQVVSSSTDVVAPPDLQISGSIQDGYLYSTAGQWPSDTATWYQWYKNDVAISGATSSTYAVQAGDVNANITLKVTGNRSLFPSITSTSNSLQLIPLTPTPTINGSPSVGSTLTANTGIWNTGVTMTYQWLRSGSPISGATGATYILSSSDLGQTISLRVSGAKSGVQYGTATSTSTPAVGEAAFSLTPIPQISGIFSVGERLTADAGTWDSGTYLTYYWYKNGQQIVGTGFGPAYTLTSDDLGKDISVTVTGYKTGFATTAITSESHLVSEGTFSSTTPNIFGNPWPGEILRASYGNISPRPSSYFCQWRRDGVPILGANDCVYTATLTDIGHSISYLITSQLTGYTSLSELSTSVPISLGNLSSSPLPQIGGYNSVGYLLEAYPGQWDTGVNFSFQWLRNGAPLPGATLSTYSLTNDDAGSNISVEIQGSKTGYTPIIRTSVATEIVRGGIQTLTPVPSISGISHVGQTLVATSHTWDTGTSLSYKWRCSGTEIPGATAETYVLQANDAGCSMTVDVTSSRTGFADVLKSSVPTPIVTGGFLSNTPIPTISGIEMNGNTLIANSGNWDPGVQIRYQWLRNQTLITGANEFYYQLAPADVGSRVTVQVIGSRAGFTSVIRTSLETQQIADLPAPVLPSPNYRTSPNTNTNFVYQAYKDFLGRLPTATEVTSWSTKLSSGSENQASIARNLSTSDEWIQVVIRSFYIDTLGREPDSAGYQYWIGRARGGMSTSDIGAFFYGSDEYFNGYGQGNLSLWISDLYRKLMLRSADSGGLNYWVVQLQSGAMNRTQVSKWFYQSPEKRGLRVDALYSKLLNRGSDPSGRAYWAERLYNEGDLALASMLASSPEYFGRQFSE